MTWTQYLVIVGVCLVISGGSIFFLLHFFMLHFLMFSLFGLAEEEPAADAIDEQVVHASAVYASAVTAALLDAGQGTRAHRRHVCPYGPGTCAAEMWRSSYDRVTADIYALNADAVA